MSIFFAKNLFSMVSACLLLPLLAIWYETNHVTACEKATRETQETKTANILRRGAPAVHRIPNGYMCQIIGRDLPSAVYTWSRQNSASLPDGLRAEGNRLYVMKSTSDLNGLYYCNITHKHTTYSASVYIGIQDSGLYGIFKKALELLTPGGLETTHAQKF